MPSLIDFITRIYELELVDWEFFQKQQYSQESLAMVDSTIDTALKLTSNKEMGGSVIFFLAKLPRAKNCLCVDVPIRNLFAGVCRVSSLPPLHKGSSIRIQVCCI